MRKPTKICPNCDKVFPVEGGRTGNARKYCGPPCVYAARERQWAKHNALQRDVRAGRVALGRPLGAFNVQRMNAYWEKVKTPGYYEGLRIGVTAQSTLGNA